MYCEPINKSDAIYIAWCESKGMKFMDRIRYTKRRYKVILEEWKFSWQE